jgi:hypothetical protein
MRVTPRAIITLFISYWATRIYHFGEVDGEWLDFFPYSDELLTLRTWLWFAGTRLSKVIFLHGLYLMATGHFWFFNLIFWLEAIELVDFLLNYNEQLIEIGTFKPEFEDFKLLVITFAGAALLRNVVKK